MALPPSRSTAGSCRSLGASALHRITGELGTDLPAETHAEARGASGTHRVQNPISPYGWQQHPALHGTQPPLQPPRVTLILQGDPERVPGPGHTQKESGRADENLGLPDSVCMLKSPPPAATLHSTEESQKKQRSEVCQ